MVDGTRLDEVGELNVNASSDSYGSAFEESNVSVLCVVPSISVPVCPRVHKEPRLPQLLCPSQSPSPVPVPILFRI